MRFLGLIVVAALGIAALRLAIIVLLVANCIALVVGLIKRPKETLGALVLLMLTTLVGR